MYRDAYCYNEINNALTQEKRKVTLLMVAEHIHDALHNVIFRSFIRFVFGRNFQYRRNRLFVRVQQVSNVVGDVLIDQNDCNIFRDV